MDSRRLIVFILLSIGLLFLWDKYLAPKTVDKTHIVTSVNNSEASVVAANAVDSGLNLNNDKLITVTTDLVQAQISTIGGDLRSLSLLAHGAVHDKKEPYKLFTNNDNKIFVAQTGLVSNSGVTLPTHNTVFTADSYNYTLAPDTNDLIISLKANESDIGIIKTYTFKRNSYVVDVSYQIINNTNNPLSGISAYWRILRDETAPEGDMKFVHTYTGAAYYTLDNKFNKLSFSDIQKNDTNYPEVVNNGWVGYIQHYFTAMWMLNAYGYNSVCVNGVQCRLNFKMAGNDLASAGVLTDLPLIKAHSSYSIAVPLFAGPEEYKALSISAPELERTKDYGWVYIFATPLFWLLVKLFNLLHNWGWAIIALTVVVKAILYPLTRAGYISMAKMKVLAPKMEALKKQYGDDKVKLQQAMMGLYKSEKVNPIGGCLPMILQIPVFIGLYWALLSSVELRQASFLWIQDLSLPDPYYILPSILALTMFLQTFISPPPSDPLQAKMMRIMPVAFSVMFFFFPAGLVVYWLVNNILSIAQQWYVNNHVTLRRQNRK
ncbi:MAG: membrane protein insertase YidC [Proteobacteria bacterium]|jgi:YidC/Oxa1 family membrane protein insertase|nr:membrane protein insertase YidC [Pseudomonadota bacterium]